MDNTARESMPPIWKTALAQIDWPTQLSQPSDAESPLLQLNACLQQEGSTERCVCQWTRDAQSSAQQAARLLLVREDPGSKRWWYAVLPWPSFQPSPIELRSAAIPQVSPEEFYQELAIAQVVWSVRRQGTWRVLPSSRWYGSYHVELGTDPEPALSDLHHHDPIIAWDDLGLPINGHHRQTLTIASWEHAHRLHPDLLDALLDAVSPSTVEEDPDDWDQHDMRPVFDLNTVIAVMRDLGLSTPYADPALATAADTQNIDEDD